MAAPVHWNYLTCDEKFWYVISCGRCKVYDAARYSTWEQNHIVHVRTQSQQSTNSIALSVINKDEKS